MLTFTLGQPSHSSDIQDQSSSSASHKTPRQLFDRTLETLGQDLYKQKLPTIRQAYNCYTPTLFISYAWEDDIKQWVDQDLSQDFKRLGFEVLYDQERNVAGSVLPDFENKVSQSTYVVVVCTPHYLKRYLEHDPTSGKTTGVGREMEKIVRRLQENVPGKVLPIYRKGRYAECVPPLLQHLVALPAGDPQSYYKTIFDLSQTLFMFDTITADPIHRQKKAFLKAIEPVQDSASSKVSVHPRDLDQDHLPLSLDLQTLYDRIVHNRLGTCLNLREFHPKTQASSLLLDALKVSSSVRELDLTQALLEEKHYLSLGSMLHYNTSLRHLNLTKTPCSEQAFEALVKGIAAHPALESLTLPDFNFPLTTTHLEKFYALLSSHKTLERVNWPFPIDSALGKSLRKLAQKNRVAALHLAMMPQHGPEQAQSLLQKADQLGHPAASYHLGKLFEQQNLKEQAVHAFQKAAEQSEPRANLWMGEYWRGVWKKESREPDYDKASVSYQKAALLGQEEALYRLGRLQENSKLSFFNPKEALICYQKAARRGHLESMIALARLYSDPESLFYDLEQASLYKTQAEIFSTTSTAQWYLQEMSKGRPQLP